MISVWEVDRGLGDVKLPQKKDTRDTFTIGTGKTKLEHQREIP